MGHRYGPDPEHAEGWERLGPKPVRIQRDADGVAGLAGPTTRPEVLGSQGLLHLQRAAGNAGATTLFEEQSPVVDVASGGGGRALDEPLRTEMEARLGHTFADVRIHTGSAADQSAKAVQAQAYTVGSNVVFRDGAYDPSSATGRTLLAHELTHVVQQRSGPVDGTPAAGGVRVSDPADRFELQATANAERVLADPAPAQRQAAPDEDED